MWALRTTTTNCRVSFYWLLFSICCKLSRNFVWALKTTTTNCRLSFTDFYSAFPTNVRIVFLPHTNTVILLDSHCCSIPEPGLPVMSVKRESTVQLRFNVWTCHLRVLFYLVFVLCKPDETSCEAHYYIQELGSVVCSQYLSRFVMICYNLLAE